MTKQKRAAYKRLIERHTLKNAATKEIARASLIKEGIYDVNGKLAPEFGGKGVARAPKAKTIRAA